MFYSKNSACFTSTAIFFSMSQVFRWIFNLFTHFTLLQHDNEPAETQNFHRSEHFLAFLFYHSFVTVSSSRDSFLLVFFFSVSHPFTVMQQNTKVTLSFS